MTRRGAFGDPEANRVLRQFGEDLRAARRAAGLTQAQVGERAGVTQETVSLAEQGKQNLRWSIMYALACSVGCRLRLGVDVVADADEQRVLRRFGEGLRAAREADGRTQEQIAAKAGVSQRTVTYAERGKRNLRWSIMYALARAVGRRLELALDPAGRNSENGGH